MVVAVGGFLQVLLLRGGGIPASVTLRNPCGWPGGPETGVDEPIQGERRG